MQSLLTDVGDYLNAHLWAVAAFIFASLVIISAIADRKRHRRMNIDDVGFMPWTGITVFSVLAALLSIALAIKSN